MSADIAPDIVCPHCGPCIVCPHTMYYVKPTSTPDERTDDRPANWHEMGFCARMDWIKVQRDGKPSTPAPTPKPPTVTAAPGKNPVYVAAAIRKELDGLAALPAVPNARNDTLNIVALKVFGFVKGGHADKQACWDELKRIGSAIGLTDSEMVGFDGAHGTLGSAWKGATPRQVPSQVVEI